MTRANNGCDASSIVTLYVTKWDWWHVCCQEILWGVSKLAVGLLMAYRRGGTTKHYSVYTKNWTAFCLQKKVDNLQPPIREVLDFLSELYNQGLSYSAINSARGALSSYVSLDDGYMVEHDPLVCRLVKGVFQLRPPKPKYTEVGDVQVVWTYLTDYSLSCWIINT